MDIIRTDCTSVRHTWAIPWHGQVGSSELRWSSTPYDGSPCIRTPCQSSWGGIVRVQNEQVQLHRVLSPAAAKHATSLVFVWTAFFITSISHFPHETELTSVIILICSRKVPFGIICTGFLWIECHYDNWQLYQNTKQNKWFSQLPSTKQYNNLQQQQASYGPFSGTARESNDLVKPKITAELNWQWIQFHKCKNTLTK